MQFWEAQRELQVTQAINWNGFLALAERLFPRLKHGSHWDLWILLWGHQRHLLSDAMEARLTEVAVRYMSM